MKQLQSIILAAVYIGVLITSVLSQKPPPGLVEQASGNRSETKRDFPFIVLVERLDTNGGHCAGSLVYPDAVLTSAHCLLRFDKPQSAVFPEHIRVVAGIEYRKSHKTDPENSKTDPDSQVGYARGILLSWDIYSNDTFLRDDIAIIKLKEKFKLTPTVQTISLPPKDFTVETKSEGTLVGWGNVDDVTLQRTIFTLQKVHVCGAHDDFAYHNRESLILCASGHDKSICMGGDEGGPLLVKNQKGNLTLYGTAYRSRHNCDSNAAVEFANVPKYVEWIKTISRSDAGSGGGTMFCRIDYILMLSIFCLVYAQKQMFL